MSDVVRVALVLAGVAAMLVAVTGYRTSRGRLSLAYGVVALLGAYLLAAGLGYVEVPVLTAPG